jgi:hypothetical protein
MKMKHPENDYLSLKLEEALIDDHDEADLLENTDNYDVDARSGTQYTTGGRTYSICSDNHMENIEKVRSLSFV